MKILSLDVDLNEINAWSSVDGRVCSGQAEIPWSPIREHDLILMEVASPVFYTDNVKEIGARARWTVFNSMIAGRIFQFLDMLKMGQKMLVAPSSDWTLGHPEELRRQIAGVAGDNHDIRECRCMQVYYKTNPGKWKPFPEFFGSLSQAGKKRRK